MQTIDVKFLRDNHAKDEAWYQIAIDGKDAFKASIPLTQKASGPPSPEKRIREWLFKRALPNQGAEVHIPGYEIDPRFF